MKEQIFQMKKIIISAMHNTSISEKFILISLILLPLALASSILIAELLSAFIGIFTLIWIFKNKKDLKIFQDIKIVIFTILLFYLIILLSLGFSYNLNKSFLPSFFYFRYLLLSLGIFVLIYKFEQTLRLIFFSLLLLLFLIVVDSSFEFIKLNYLCGFEWFQDSRPLDKSCSSHFITSFFGDEKKLGSFLVRLCPLILSLIIFLDVKAFNKYDIKIPILIILSILIFLTSERVALFLFIFILIFLLKFFKRKLYFLFFSILTLALLMITQPKLIQKYVYATLFQFEILESSQMYEWDNKSGERTRVKILENSNFSNIKYLSDEHEKLIKSGIIIFKENPFTGTGLKNYHRYCKNIKEERSLDIKCSSHPHNTYIQIFSDIGILGGLMMILIFLYIVRINIKILFIEKPSKIQKSFYVLNLGIIINLMPFIPSGSFFNNWINLMLYFPLGTWFYLFYCIKKDKKFD